MDGSFLDLNGESMQVEVEEFSREIYKILKFFQQKQKKTEQEREKVAEKTKESQRGPREDDPSKRENPTILMCSRVMEQVKEFKVLHVATLFIGKVLTDEVS